MHSFHELTSDSQAEATATSSTMHIALQADEPFKNCLLFMRRDAIPTINHVDPYHRRLLLFERGGNANRRLPGGVAQGIGKEVAEDLFQAGIIAPDDNGIGDIDRDLALLLENDRFKEINNICADFLEWNG